MSIGTAVRPLAVLALAGALSGWVVHEQEADVTFLWDFAGQGCTEAGVRFVDVYLEDLGDGSVDEVIGIACEDGGVTVTDLEPGRYYAAFFGDDGWFAEADVRLRGGDNEFAVHLTR